MLSTLEETVELWDTIKHETPSCKGLHWRAPEAKEWFCLVDGEYGSRAARLTGNQNQYRDVTLGSNEEREEEIGVPGVLLRTLRSLHF